MTTLLATTRQSTQKKTFSIKKDFIKKLENEKNKSKIVNKALDLYFSREIFLKQADEEFIKSFESDFFTEEQNFSLITKWKNDYKKISALVD